MGLAAKDESCRRPKSVGDQLRALSPRDYEGAGPFKSQDSLFKISLDCSSTECHIVGMNRGLFVIVYARSCSRTPLVEVRRLEGCDLRPQKGGAPLEGTTPATCRTQRVQIASPSQSDYLKAARVWRTRSLLGRASPNPWGPNEP